MTNKEKYAKEILDVVCLTGKRPALVHGNIYGCINTFCERCRFGGSSNCTTQFIKWVKEEYKEPEIDWTNVPENTRVQIKGTGDQRWKNRYFAFCKDGVPYVFCGGTDSWSAENGWDSTFPITEFTECRFADEEMEKEYWKD